MKIDFFMQTKKGFDEHHLLKNLKHYLPAQAPLKDFVHHNTLHEFQHLKFHDGLAQASTLFGYKVYLSLSEYWELFAAGKISEEILRNSIVQKKGLSEEENWFKKILEQPTAGQTQSRIGSLRCHWKEQYAFDLNGRVHVNIFRLLNSYLDQGVAIWSFPCDKKIGFLNAVRKLESNSFSSLFKTLRAKELLQDESISITDLLKLLVSDETLFERYVFDQQFEHPGWSGLVAVIEEQPNTLLDQRIISLEDLIKLELIFEIDTLDHRFKNKWKPLAETLTTRPMPFSAAFQKNELDDYFEIWQEAYEWTYYDEVIAGLSSASGNDYVNNESKSFQAFFCIDDREISLRSYLERTDEHCETFGTPGHFGIDTYYQPQNGKFHTKICPLPITPKHLICEIDSNGKNKKELHFHKRAHYLFGGWIIAQTLGFWTGLKLFLNVFKPSISPASASAFRHMDQFSSLTVENKNLSDTKEGLQIGYTVLEMTDRVEAVLRSVGLTKNFSDFIYIIGHGASSTNNTHFSAYDCGACSGRPGSVNARAFSNMANHAQVRKNLADRMILIPDETIFIGGLHDTTCDEILFYDLNILSEKGLKIHQKNELKFKEALFKNAKERSRRFDLVNTRKKDYLIHRRVKLRAVSLFEPRPEYNHATNTLCIIGPRSLTQNLFLDRRAFLNSYDCFSDPDGKYLLGILNAAAPVCGGINLEYYFSRVDNQKLGAGSKLPHNVMGLIGVANGIEGDLRTGLPYQMVEIHDPLRLLIVVQHYPEVVLKTIQTVAATYEWFKNAWVNLIVKHPETNQFYKFINGDFILYTPVKSKIPRYPDSTEMIESTSENLPVFIINK